MRTAIATAPATVANVGPGFDVLGLCLEEPRDRVRAELTADGRVELVAVEGDEGRLSRVAAENCAGVAAQAVLERFGAAGSGVRLWLDKGLPLGSGLGSSAASAVAAALATARLVCPEVPKEALLDACREGERLATGSPHPDNVAPSLLGGLVACLPGAGEAVEVVRLALPAGLHVVCVKPDVEVRTADARRVMPAAIPVADVVRTLAAMAGLVTALASGDLELAGRCLDDRVATPYRRALIPGYDAVMEALLRAGAVGGGISGSGPTVFALAGDRECARRAADAMVEAFATAGHAAMALVSAVDPSGARLEP
ncbi:MAG: homoserine kinase [Deltaproteobacteria bacterium]|nr:homoserine kinase [Deltaproteobacteria bacterium]